MQELNTILSKNTIPLKAFAAIIITLVFLFSACNFIHQMHHADKKAFWLDEAYSLKNTIQDNTYWGLLTKADLHTQSSTAPLDFIFTKILDDIKKSAGSFGLSDRVFYRLWANFVMTFCGFFVVCLFVVNILSSPSSKLTKGFQLLLLSFLPLLYIYRPLAYHFAAEVRPYALWFALWFITIAVCSMPRINKFVLTLCLSLLAMTMIASLFQIFSIAAAYFIVQCMQHGWKQALKDCVHVFTLPLLIVFYYAYPASYNNRFDEPLAVIWRRFHEQWGHEMITVPLLLVSIITFGFSRQTRTQITGPLAVIFVLLMGPLILATTLHRGYFYTERQYIYYDADRAVFWLSLINVLPFYLERIKDYKKRLIVMSVILGLSIAFVFPKKTISHIRAVNSSEADSFAS